MLKRRTDRYPIGSVLPLAEDIFKKLEETAPVKKLCVAGSLRKWRDTIKDIDILATSNET